MAKHIHIFIKFAVGIIIPCQTQKSLGMKLKKLLASAAFLAAMPALQAMNPYPMATITHLQFKCDK